MNPVRPNKLESNKPCKTTRSNRVKKPKLLTIDDEAEFVDMIKNYFGLRGYEVFTAVRGAIGLGLIEKEKPDVVLIDFKMPGIDGDQVLSQMRKINPASQAIMITAFKDEGRTEKKFKDMGVFAYFEKPIASMKSLEEVVKKAAEKSAEEKKNA